MLSFNLFRELKAICGLEGRWALMIYDCFTDQLHINEVLIYRHGTEVSYLQTHRLSMQLEGSGDRDEAQENSGSTLHGLIVREDGTVQVSCFESVELFTQLGNSFSLGTCDLVWLWIFWTLKQQMLLFSVTLTNI